MPIGTKKSPGHPAPKHAVLRSLLRAPACLPHKCPAPAQRVERRALPQRADGPGLHHRGESLGEVELAARTLVELALLVKPVYQGDVGLFLFVPGPLPLYVVPVFLYDYRKAPSAALNMIGPFSGKKVGRVVSGKLYALLWAQLFLVDYIARPNGRLVVVSMMALSLLSNPSQHANPSHLGTVASFRR